MKWAIDPAHTQIEFTAKHMMITTVRGRFAKFEGTLDLDEEHPTQSIAEGAVDIASLDTHDPNRDAHLRSPDFFDVERYPTMQFRSTEIKQTGSTQYLVTGDMTIRDVTRPVTFQVTDEGKAKDPWGNWRRGFTAQTVLNRKNWGLNWNVALEAGGWLVSDEIRVSIDVEAVLQQEQPANAVAQAESATVS